MSKITNNEIDESTLKSSGSAINTGTDDTKFATPKAIADSTVAKGPASSVNNHIALFNGATGKLLKGSGYQIRFATAVITTNSSGDGSITYSSAFTTSTLCVIISNGDQAAAVLSIGVIDTPTKSTFNFNAKRASTGSAFIGTCRINYIAFGV